MRHFNRICAGLVAGVLFAFAGAAGAMDDEALARILDQRLLGDASGACIAAAVVDGDRVARAWRCADPANVDRVGPDVAFEIGSITKTMTAFVLADLVARGQVSLDDALSDYLPGTAVPDYQGQPILLRHIVTHTSGLPRLPPVMGRVDLDPANPYATLDADALLASLQDVTLAQAPGERFEYSNFGPMLLSLALARHAGTDFEQLLDERLFTPLGMDATHIVDQPRGVRLAAGHLPGGEPASPWTFAVDLAGAGGVRSTLDDMVRYAQAQLDPAPGPVGEAIALARRPIETAAEQAMAMGWLLLPLGESTLHMHNGGTGGFSSVLVFDYERGRAAVVLADTGLAMTGGVDDVGLHLLDPRVPLGKPQP